jgi:hypothetical protein
MAHHHHHQQRQQPPPINKPQITIQNFLVIYAPLKPQVCFPSKIIISIFFFIESKRPTTTANVLSQSLIYESDHSREVRKAGINLNFPGRTEFMDRYKKPEELAYSPFTINPQPDFTLTGRPLARLVPDAFNSEYTRR